MQENAILSSERRPQILIARRSQNDTQQDAQPAGGSSDDHGDEEVRDGKVVDLSHPYNYRHRLGRSARAIKEPFLPPKNFRYPYMEQKQPTGLRKRREGL